MSWTSPADLRRQVENWWDKGLLLAEPGKDEPEFPRRLTLKTPNSAEITAQGVGKSGLLVPTADGVREAQNRRAEIVIDAK